MTEKILFVDDETYILQSLKRELGFQYAVTTAGSGAEGLELVRNQGPFAVIIADYRMPKMDGVQFLRQVTTLAPTSVRMMLTGNADMQTAIDAVNEGQIFRFLTKPCPPDLMTRSLDAGIKQYHLVIAEKELLENTLVESINLLTELLSIVNPKAYGKSNRVRELVAHISRTLNLNGAWQYETAAALSQLGWVAFSRELLNKLDANQELSAAERLTFAKHPFLAKKLLSKIPRLELVSRIIEGQERSIDDLCLDPLAGDSYFVDLGAHILKVCVDYDNLILSGQTHDAALTTLYSSPNKYKVEILDALSKLRSFQQPKTEKKIESIRFEDLETGMIIAEPIKNHLGRVLIDKDTVVTRRLIVELYTVANRPGYLVEPLMIVRP